MPALNSYDYAIVRVVPCVERGECINVGVILFCRTRRFLGVLISLDTPHLMALFPALDIDAVRNHLDIIVERPCKLLSAHEPALGELRIIVINGTHVSQQESCADTFDRVIGIIGGGSNEQRGPTEVQSADRVHG